MNRILSLCMYCCVLSVIATTMSKFCKENDDECSKNITSVTSLFNCGLCIYFLFIYKEHVTR